MPFVLICLISLAVLFVGRIVYFLEPYGISTDENTFLAVAEAWSHYGQIYVDSIERKPPVLYLPYVWFGEIFGYWNMTAFHICLNLLWFGMGLMSDKVARVCFPKIPKGLTLFLYCIISVSLTREYIAGNCEIVMLVPLGLSLLVLLKVLDCPKNHVYKWVFLATCLAATSTLIKQIGALPYAFACFGVAVVWWVNKSEFSSRMIQSVGGVVTGLIVTYGLLVLWMIFEGSLEEFWFWAMQDNFRYLGDVEQVETAKRSMRFLTPFAVVFLAWPVFGYSFLKSSLSLKTNAKQWVVFSACVGAFITLFVGGRYYSHYFVTIAWFLAILGAWWVASVWQSDKMAWRRGLILVGLFLPAFIGFFLTNFREEFMGAVSPGKKSHSFYKAAVQDIVELGQWVQENSQTEDRIVVWGMASQIYSASQRGAGSRFIYGDAVSGRVPGLPVTKRFPVPDAMELYLEDMTNKKPIFFIDTNKRALNTYQHYPVDSYPELYAFLNENYENLGEIEGFGVWKIK